MRTSRPTKNDAGFILIVVISAMALLAVIAATFTRSAIVHVRTVASQVEITRADALAEAGVNLAVLNLVSFRANPSLRQRGFAVEGKPLHCRYGGDHLVIHVEDEGGKIDLNFSGERLLRALFIGLNVSPDRAAEHVDAILDYRDVDDDKRQNGAEKAEYLAAGRIRGPKNGPFAIIEELYQVFGVGADLVERMLPFVTAHSGRDGIDPEIATHQLKELLATGDRNSHLSGIFDDVDHAPQSSGLPAHFAAPSNRRFFTVRSEALMASGVRFIREAIIDISPVRTNRGADSQAQSPPYRVWRWRRATSSGGAALDASPAVVPPC